MMRLLSTLLFASLCLPAQNMPVPDGQGRVLQLFDLDSIRGGADTTPAAEQAAAATPPGVARLDPDGTFEHSVSLDSSQFLRQFLDPPLGEGDDLQVLGGRWLALLGSPAQIASAERVFAATAANKDRPIEVDVRVSTITKAGFEGKVRDLLRDGKQGQQSRWELVMNGEAATRLLAAVEDAQGNVLEGPRLLVRALQRATIQVADQVSYIKDFELTRNGDAVIAEPVIGIATDGMQADIVATFLEPELIAVACDVQIQQVQRPIPEFQTTVASNVPVKIQLPHVTGVRFQQVSRIHTTERVVFAAQQVSGDYLLVIVRAEPKPRLPR